MQTNLTINIQTFLNKFLSSSQNRQQGALDE
jgi:hypothetical protein